MSFVNVDVFCFFFFDSTSIFGDGMASFSNEIANNSIYNNSILHVLTTIRFKDGGSFRCFIVVAFSPDSYFDLRDFFFFWVQKQYSIQFESDLILTALWMLVIFHTKKFRNEKKFPKIVLMDSIRSILVLDIESLQSKSDFIKYELA